MFWSAIAPLMALLIDLVAAGRQSDCAKDLAIVL